MTDPLVTISVASAHQFQGNEIEYNGSVFNCNNSDCDAFVCCNSIAGGNRDACVKCSCQSKLQGGYCYYHNVDTCSGTCDSHCGSCENAVVFDPPVTMSVPCSQATEMLTQVTEYQLDSLSQNIISQVCTQDTRL